MVQRMLAGGLIAAACGLAPIWVCGAQAQDIAKALDHITTTADKICGIVATRGSSSDMKIKGQVQVEVSGLLKKLGDLGVTVSPDVSKSAYDSVGREELRATLDDVRKCKLDVYKDLRGILIPVAPVPGGRGATEFIAPNEQKNSARLAECDPVDLSFRPENFGPGMIGPGVSTIRMRPNPNNPCQPSGTWQKIDGAWRKISD
ncbi:hypothetical protein HZZ13_23305 [Bradyrhizobium sp. CNPSo 4010]|uniref:Secreted protein n=1 Tax=Bradyrhizobium agreste TaxID=2751811 RepID=A0ABS0PU18_9BRAD|nr:hypothetical protein [Bradyrhizobium agreste]MBH5400695.1 hypothetical protein [Bradyrhizobium agreste]